MSRLFKQIQKSLPREQIFTTPLKPFVEQEHKFDPFPLFCVVALFVGVIIACFCSGTSKRSAALPKQATKQTVKQTVLPKKNTVELTKKTTPVPTVVANMETPIPEKTLKNKAFEKEPKLAENISKTKQELNFHPLQWDTVSVKTWIQDRLDSMFPNFQTFKDSLQHFAYLDEEPSVSGKDLSVTAKEHFELIQRFLKKFKIEAVRIDGSYSRVMANGQNYYVNTLVSQRPRLKLTHINTQEMIFEDEYNQEYRKKISQND